MLQGKPIGPAPTDRLEEFFSPEAAAALLAFAFWSFWVSSWALLAVAFLFLGVSYWVQVGRKLRQRGSVR